MQAGGELASNPMMNHAWKTTMIYGVPLITVIFMLYWPGALQLTFAFTSMLSLTQSYCLRHPGIRKFLNIQPLPVNIITQSKPPPRSPYTGRINRNKPPALIPPSPVTAEEPPARKGFLEKAVSDIKVAASDVMKAARNERDESSDSPAGSGRRTSEELRRAKQYDQRRRKEIAASLKSKESRYYDGRQRQTQKTGH